MRRPRLNPVLAREVRERMRGPRAALVVTAYLGMLTGVFVLVYQAQSGDQATGLGPLAATEVARVGRGIFEWVVFVMLVLVLFMVPGLTSGAIAGERERQTLIPLQVTLLPARSIVLGKITASLAFLFLLVVASAPLLAVAYLIGGVGVPEVAAAIGVVVGSGVVLACFSMACSTLFRRVQAATVAAYGTVLTMVLGSFVAYAALGLVDEGRGTDEANPPAVILVPNPLALAADLIGGGQDDTAVGTDSPLQPVRELLDPLAYADDDEDEAVQDRFAELGIAIGPDGFPIDEDEDEEDEEEEAAAAAAEADDETIPFWLQSAVTLGAFAAAAVVVSTMRLRTPAEVER